MDNSTVSPRAPRKARRGGGYYRSADGTWCVDLVFKGFRIRRRLGRGLSADVVKQMPSARAWRCARRSCSQASRPPPRPPSLRGAAPRRPREDPDLTAVLLLYALTLFAGATLLFVVQPMVGKMILPLLGGTPAVWSTCMVFFQAALLGGYAYAHASTARLRPSRQALLHLVVLAVPLAVLPLAVNPRLLRGGEANPVLDVLTLLSVSVGLPFLVVSATAPLLQKWFTRTGHPAARDPYFLYAASNLGSMLALLGYPTLVEPRLRAAEARAGSPRPRCGAWAMACSRS